MPKLNHLVQLNLHWSYIDSINWANCDIENQLENDKNQMTRNIAVIKTIRNLQWVFEGEIKMNQFQITQKHIAQTSSNPNWQSICSFCLFDNYRVLHFEFPQHTAATADEGRTRSNRFSNGKTTDAKSNYFVFSILHNSHGRLCTVTQTHTCHRIDRVTDSIDYCRLLSLDFTELDWAIFKVVFRI